ncbi:hydrogenase iron-sulfur subunit [Dethiosulfatarculus sandiegensis]|jgi:coenzyme F420-reducing hydrogenase delta subunit|uniref:F420-non-reducing hydrogenase iron-sulfur subunit D n=1 Tax=Dethiosulfatarculus sandiegensis TaxID=1429043 RepID=A0A0D2JCL0_9BACT|nr:hydrogenase iron-sulfur subunit [Dethiosulfatarculus sandiegensis]KIX15879.1 F420-non-reducing hydrogenase iron-sulfur subunit D [Dethiosulfatarculus sandiegensis]
MAAFEPIVVAFACHYCAYTAADMAGTMRLEYPANVNIIKVPCTGKVDTIHIMRALQKGADGVLVAGCLVGDCHFKNGNVQANNRVTYVQELLKDIGIESERVEMVHMSAGQGRQFAEIATEFTEKIRQLGPNPIKEGSKKAAA